MLSVGEESGALDEILAKTSDFYDMEADDAIQKLVTMLEPLMIVILGGIVGTVVIGIMAPIYGMYGNAENI
jgi:type IV pilus assembly protein PilC